MKDQSVVGRTGWRYSLRQALRWRVGSGVLAVLASTLIAAPPTGQGKPSPAATPAGKAPKAEWHSLFDGKTLKGWKETPFTGRGEVYVKNGSLILDTGLMTGVTWTNAFPKLNFEISLDAMRVSGSDFFCGLTFPYRNSYLTLIVGGWGGGVVGISSLDGLDASENETTVYREFKSGKWYHVRLRVTKPRLEAWLGKEKVIDVKTADHVKFDLRPGEIELSPPLGLASYSTKAALKNIRWRRVSGPTHDKLFSR